jgi:hypothetical protein
MHYLPDTPLNHNHLYLCHHSTDFNNLLFLLIISTFRDAGGHWKAIFFFWPLNTFLVWATARMTETMPKNHRPVNEKRW